MYGTCNTGPAYYASVTAKANRKAARPKTVVTYTVRVKPTTQAVEPYTLQVALPSGVTYVKGRARGLTTQPVVSAGANGATLVTWAAVTPTKTKKAKAAVASKPMPRAFTVKARVDAGVAKGTALTFSGAVYQVNQVTSDELVCGRAAAAVTVRTVRV